LRRTLTATEREALMQTWYYPHHARLEQAVDNALAEHSRCLVLDCHSFPDQPLPYEMANPAQQRPDICIGTDDFHTPAALTAALVEQFSRAGLNVKLNDPFAGALVPTNFYHQDKRASAVMIEVNRKLYLQGDTAVQCADFDELGKGIREACIRAIQKEEHMSTIQ
jgi:N-formylglutamate amidohydrolase